MDYQVQPFDVLSFIDGVLHVNCKPFQVISIAGETQFESITGVEGKRVLTDFRGLTNQWDQDLIFGRFVDTDAE